MNNLAIGMLIGAALVAAVASFFFLVRRRAKARQTGTFQARPSSATAEVLSRSEMARLFGTNETAPSSAKTAANATTLAGLRHDLQLKYMHDEEKVNHVIALERERNPQGSEKDHMRAAIFRWERENR